MKQWFAAGLAACLTVTAVGAAELDLDFATDDELSASLEGASLTAQTLREDRDEPLSRRDIVAAAQADYQRLLAVLFEAGFFGPTISITVDGVEAASLPVITREGPVNLVRLSVQPGPAFLFGRVDVGPLPRRTDLPDGFATGQPAGTSVLRDVTRTGIDAWRARGHAKADLESQEIIADHNSRRLDAILTLAPGPRLRYGPIVIDGEDRVRERRIARIADLRQGQIFDPEQVNAAARRLQRTGAFRSVAITEAERIGPDATLPMTIQVVERLPRRFGVGAEIGTNEGLGLSAFWLHRNLTGRADSLRVEGDVVGIGGGTGGTDYGLSLGYNRPSTFNPETDLFVNAEIERLNEPEFTSDRAAVELGARRVVNEEFSYTYGIAYERNRIEDAFGERDFSILSLPLTADYDRRDQDLNPRDGYYIQAGLEPFYGLETAGPGLRFTADLRGYQGFGQDRRTVIAARVQLGSVVGPGIDDVPATDLFFSGGGGTVRGTEFQSLGIEQPDGDLVGGRSFLGLSGELRRDVTDAIGLVGFVDFGLVSVDSQWSDGETHTGAGIGIRYNTGIGPIRVDVGAPVSGPGDDGVAIYIGIGQAF
ncbi:MAG: autotransporter assembly complex family protein [Pseudomonadota bacterium]